MFEVTAEAVEFPYDKDILVPQGFETRGQPRPVFAVSGGAILVHLLRLDSGRMERVFLQVEHLRAISL
jgi:hypothetical protein